MGGQPSKKDIEIAAAKRKEYEILNDRQDALYDAAGDGSASNLCCMDNPTNGRLLCCKCIRDICNCCINLFNCKLFSCCEFDCGCPQCCQCVWCDDCCGSSLTKDLEAGEADSETDSKKIESASKEDDTSEKVDKGDDEADELLTGRRRRRLNNYYRDNYSNGLTKF